MRCIGILALPLLLVTTSAFGEEPIFSGPQVGELLAPFEAQAIFGDSAGKKLPVLAGVDDAPLLLVFVHQVTRPSIGMTRLLMDYAHSKKKKGLQSRLIFLTDDPTDTAAWFRRARRALPANVSPMISMDGIEGPGAYGLNRKMTVTVLVAHQGKVTANFPLVQPSIQADAPKIGQAIAKALGEDAAPTLQDMGFKARRMGGKKKRTNSPEQEATYRRMMGPVIQKDATAAEVATAAKRVEEFAKKNAWFKAKVHQAANTIVKSGKLSNYGTADAQACLKKWAKEMASDKDKPTAMKAAKANEEGKQTIDTTPDEAKAK